MFKKLNKISKIMLIVFISFIVWMWLFDENSFRTQRELNKELDKINTSNKYLQENITKDQQLIKDLKNPDKLEKFARETYKMKKENEDVFLIEFDTIKK